MQAEINLEDTTVPVRILGINEAEKGTNTSFTEGRALAWIQDTPNTNVWRSWNVTYRDLWILDENNEVLSVINLTSENVTEAPVYANIKETLLNYAESSTGL